MTFIFRKHNKNVYIIIFLFFLNNCQLNNKNQPHGIIFLENREKVLTIGNTNQNDVIRLIGNPHSTSLISENTWIYFERSIVKGKLIKLGRNVLKTNNILELKFNKYGILISKKIYSKENMNVVKYTKKVTKNDISKQSFVTKFLSSVKQKMYGKRKF